MFFLRLIYWLSQFVLGSDLLARYLNPVPPLSSPAAHAHAHVQSQ
jgi:hypothetical protein